MNAYRLVFAAIQSAGILALSACAGPRTIAREAYDYDGSEVAYRGSTPTSDEDLHELRGGRESSETTASSATKVNRSGKLKSRSSDTEVVNTVTDTVVEMAPIASGDEDLR